jgi:ATP-dependent RNA helicase DDX55/SPB4
MGKEGNALLFLSPEEDTYIEFLKLKKVPIAPIEDEESAASNNAKCPDVIPRIAKMIVKDREMFDRSRVAFVSYVRAYKEHLCNYIFQIQKLDLMKLARGFCLLEIPRMPELKGKTIEYVPPIPNVNVSSIPYPDKGECSLCSRCGSIAQLIVLYCSTRATTTGEAPKDSGGGNQRGTSAKEKG